MDYLNAEMKKEYFLKLREFVKTEQTQKRIYPENTNIFNAFEQCPYYDLKIVILGNEPYTDGSDHGLAWSTISGAVTPTLCNIFKEIRKDIFPKYENIEFNLSRTTNLTQWANQGVLLLNTILTAEKGKQNAHKNKGWEIFTQNTIKFINEHKYNKVVFMLWGKGALEYKEFIDQKKHLVLEAAHPNPYTASQGFFGCKHFSQANEFILKHYLNLRNQQAPIGWHLF